MKPNYPRIYPFSVTTTAQLLLAANPHRKAVLIINNSGVTVYLGQDRHVTSSNGLPIGGSQEYDNDHFNPTGEYWIIGASSATIYIEEDICQNRESD